MEDILFSGIQTFPSSGLTNTFLTKIQFNRIRLLIAQCNQLGIILQQALIFTGKDS